MKTRQQKEEQVQIIKDKLSKARSVVFADYQGFTMKQLSDLRHTLKEQDAEVSITKNTLLELSLKEANYPSLEEIKTGPTATLFSYQDEISPIKILVKALKDASLGYVKAGFLGTNYLDANQINKLATLPSKQELQGKVVGVLVAPLHGMVGVLQANLRNLVYALDQIRVQKGGE